MSTSAPPADAVLRRLEWTVLRRLDGLLHGDFRTLFRGSGLDFADLREYQFHDDVRHIDWNVTARLATPYVREFNEERDLTAWFLLDLSASVDFGSMSQRKSHVAADLCAVLARMLTRHGNRVGAMLYGHRVDTVIEPRTGRAHVLRLMHAIASRAEPTRAPANTTRLGDLLSAALSSVRRRALFFVLSDFVSTPGWQKPLAALAQRHDVVAVRLYDPLEQALPDLGMMLVEDAETGEQLFVDTHDRRFRRRFADIAATREEALRAALAGAGVDTLELSTGDDLAESLLRFVDLRKRRSRRSAAPRLPSHLVAATR